MPSPGEDIQAWSTVAANNGTADPLINWAEGQTRASVNNSSRSEMAAHAKRRDLLNGSIVTTGSPNAQAFLSGIGYTSMPTGLVVKLKIGSGLTNTGPATLAMDGLGALPIVLSNGELLRGGELQGNDFVDLFWSGSYWIFLYARQYWDDRINGGGGVIIGKQVFSTPGTFTYTPTTGTEAVIVECLGGGGGGGGTVNTVASNGVGGGGGGAGGYARNILTAAEIGGSQSVQVGAGGPGGTLGGGDGSNGTESHFGAFCIGYAGAGGPGNGGVNVLGGAGAIAGIGVIAGTGQAGEPGMAHAAVLSAQSGRGGDTAWGSGGASIVTAIAVHGNNATGYGGGGGGGASYGGYSATQGGNGAGGLVIVTEFAGRGAPGRDGLTGPQGPIGPTGPSGPGTGDVLRSGTPAAGEFAEWTDASHIRGVPATSVGWSTGDAKLTLKNVADPGWLIMDDGGIGSAASGASHPDNATQALFTLLFNNITDAFAPILTSAGAATTRAAQGSAAAAWAANCRMSLTRQLGRSLAISGAGSGLTPRQPGGYLGEETHAMTTAEMPSHQHGIADPGHTHGVLSSANLLVAPASNIAIDPGATYPSAPFSGSLPANDSTRFTAVTAATGITTTAASGSGTAMTLMQPTAFWNIMIKL